jgi:hypothetical protein
MEYILAQTDVEAKQVKKITLEEIEQLLNSGKMSIVYLDKQNSEKNIMKLVAYFNKKNRNVYVREVKFGLDKNEYLYEIHIV